MEVFISWSGDRSKIVAEALHEWLPSVIQSVEPFMSTSDIGTGSRWSQDIAEHLENAQFGLICLTQENLSAPWLLFEAGALSKLLGDSRVVPYLYGVSYPQVHGPLAQFQAALADKDSTFRVIKSINEALRESALDLARLETAFDRWWPDLVKALDNVPGATEQVAPPRTERDMLEEILGLSREIVRHSTRSMEYERDVLRHVTAHRLHIEPGDLSAALDSGNPQSLRSNSLSEAFRRHVRRWNTEQTLERFQRIADDANQLRRASENEVQSNNDTDEEPTG